MIKITDGLWKKPKEDVITITPSDGDSYSQVKNAGAITAWGNRRDKIMSSYDGKSIRGGVTMNTMGEAEGTAWGALQAINEVLDWQGRDRGGLLRAAGFTEATMQLKEQVLIRVAKRANVNIKAIVEEVTAAA